MLPCRSPSLASAFDRSRSRPCANCVFLRAPASSGHFSTTCTNERWNFCTTGSDFAHLDLKLTAENPLGTMQSVEHTLRALDKLADQEQERSAPTRKALADYQAHANKPFDHEAHMKELKSHVPEASERVRLAPTSTRDISVESESYFMTGSRDLEQRIRFESACRSLRSADTFFTLTSRA